MKKEHIYPLSFIPILLLLISSLSLFAATMATEVLLAMIPLLLCGLVSLCYTLYVFPFITFDDRRITILRLFPGHLTHIPWTEVQRISPLEYGNLFTTAGYISNIHTVRKTYSVFPLSHGFFKLLKHWETVKPKEVATPLLYEEIPINIYRKPLWKNPGFYLIIAALAFLMWSYPTFNDGHHSPVHFIWLLVVLAFLLSIIAGPYFNYYEFTSTHFRIHSPFFFWEYEVRWEDIRAIRLIKTSKSNFFIICNKDYRYKFIMMGHLLPDKIIAQLQKAQVPIQIS